MSRRHCGNDHLGPAAPTQGYCNLPVTLARNRFLRQLARSASNLQAIIREKRGLSEPITLDAFGPTSISLASEHQSLVLRFISIANPACVKNAQVIEWRVDFRTDWYSLSEEGACERWVFDAYFQYFTGEQFFQQKFPDKRSGGPFVLRHACDQMGFLKRHRVLKSSRNGSAKSL
jgi:hypothetical protein